MFVALSRRRVFTAPHEFSIGEFLEARVDDVCAQVLFARFASSTNAAHANLSRKKARSLIEFINRKSACFCFIFLLIRC